MTPQGILEDMHRFEALAGPRLDEFFDSGMWKIAKETVAASAHFEFAGAAPKIEHIEFADEMMARGLFRLPFSAVLYTADVIPKTGIVCSSAPEGHRDGLVWFVVAPAMDRAGGNYSLPLMVARLDSRDHATGEPVALSAGTIDWKSMTTMPHASRRTGRQWTEQDYEAGSEKALRMIMGGTALMMSKDVETRVEAAPAKLNARRTSQGRPEIRERRIVVIRPERQAHFKTAASEFAGLRCSPRMHWRRGHFRRIREDLIVPIAPMLINANEEAKPLVKKYVVVT